MEKANRVYFFITFPRTGSTTLTRYFHERDDMEICHEPSIAPYDKTHWGEVTATWWNDTSYNTYEESVKAIVEASKKRDVFIKDIVWSAHEFLQSNEWKSAEKELNVKYYMLIRDAESILVSFAENAKLSGQTCNSEELITLINYRKMIEIANIVNVEKVFRYEDVSRDITMVSKALGISRLEKEEWASISPEDVIESWREGKKLKFFDLWHGRGIRSRSMKPSRTLTMEDSSSPKVIEEAMRVLMPDIEEFFEAVKGKILKRGN